MTALGALLRLVPPPARLRLRYLHERRRGVLPVEMRHLMANVRGGDVAIDAGASYGVYAHALSRRFRRVEAFEPNPEVAQELRRSAGRKIHVHAVALSSQEGTARLHVPAGAHGPWLGTLRPVSGEARQHEVALRTLDSYGFEGVGAMKVDVEGHELDVLRGAGRTLERERPPVLLEVEQRHLAIPMGQVFSFLEKRGFVGHFIAEGALRPLSGFSYERHQEPFLDRVLSPDYVNGFLFVPEETPAARPR